MKMTITLADETIETLDVARRELDRSIETVRGLVETVKGSTLALGRYLISVRDSGRTLAELKANEIRKVGTADGRRSGFSIWYTRAGLGKSEVSAWIRYAETVDASGLDLSTLSQGAVLALASANDDEKRAVLATLDENDESISAPNIRRTRKVLDALRDPGPTNENENENDENDDDDDESLPLDDALDAVEIAGYSATTRTVEQVREIANNLLALANEMEMN